MNRDDELSELLLRWEQLHDLGREIAAEQLCSHCPELIPDLKQQIDALRAIGKLLEAPQRVEERIAADRPLASNLVTQSSYQVLRSHAKGGLGEVLVAYDQRLGRNVAIKVMRAPFDRDPQRQRRFVREAEITSRLEHPGIVPIHGIGQNSGNLCYTMRLVSGQTLQQAIEKFHQSTSAAGDPRSVNLELRQLLGRFVSVCNTIAYAHSQGVIHRDIKPKNIMLGQFGETLVVDWGLAKKTNEVDTANKIELPGDGNPLNTEPIQAEQIETQDEHEQLTVEGFAIGTPAFMSPEQAGGQSQNVRPASDIYSLGVTLYVLLTSRAPFEAQHIAELNRKRNSGEFLPPRHFNSAIARPLESICLKAMALNPADRYSSALKLAEDIENWMADEPVSTHQESLGQRVRRWMRRHRLLVTGAAASGLVTIVALIGFLAYFTRTNEQLRQANREEGLARSQAQRSEILAIENARMAGKQSELALRTLQSVTLDIQRQLKNIPAAHTVRRRLLDTAIKGLAEVAAKLEQRPSVDQALLVAHRDLGDIYFEVGNESALGGIEAARVQFQRALEIAEQLVQANPTDRSRLHDVARCYDRLGEVALRSGSTALGREQFQKSLDIRQRLSLEAREDAQTHLSVATSLSKLGELSLKGNDVQAALESFHRALELRKRYSSSTDSLEQRELSLIYNHVGFATQRLGDADKALEYFRLGLEIVQPRADQLPDDILAARDLADTLAYLAGAYTALGDHQPAAEYYVKSMDIYSQQALADPHNAIVQRGLLMSVEAMAKHCTRRGQVEEARRYVQRMVEIGQQLVATNPSDSRAKRDLALALTNLADLHVTDAQFDEAIELHERALVIFRQRAASDPDDRRGPSDIAVCLAGLAIP